VTPGREEPGTPGDTARWQSARTLADLGELTAQWLEGAITPHPNGHDRPDEETEGLVPILARANRAGYVTDFSQPGEQPATGYDGRTWEQRAAVGGVADDQVLARLRECASDSGLVIIARKAAHLPPQLLVSYRDAIPVTCADEEPVTWAGAVVNRGEQASGYDETCHPAAVEALCAAWQVSVVDLEWGRNDVLWDALARFASHVPDHGQEPAT